MSQNKKTHLKYTILLIMTLLASSVYTVTNADGWEINSGTYTKIVNLDLQENWKCKKVNVKRSMVGGTDLIEVRITNLGAFGSSESQLSLYATAW